MSLCIDAIGIMNYCDAASAPVMVGATYTPTPVTVVGQNTYFTCGYGNVSTGGNQLPYYTCLAYNATVGTWSGITYTCERTLTHAHMARKIHSYCTV